MNINWLTKQSRQRGPDAEKLYAFPEDFRMVAGDPLQRNYTGELAAQAVSFACLDYSGGPTTQTKELPNKNCPNGVRAQIYFPSCWDGTNLDSPDHKSHMSYPVAVLTTTVIVLPRTRFISFRYFTRSSIRPICLRLSGMETHNRLSFLMVILQDMDSMVIL